MSALSCFDVGMGQHGFFCLVSGKPQGNQSLRSCALSSGRKASDKLAEKDDAAVSKVPPADRIRAICALVSLGSIKPADLPSGAMRAAVASVKDGSAFMTTCYADEIASYIQR